MGMHDELRAYGVQVVTLNPGAFRNGFNDTGMGSMDQWWRQGDGVVAHWPVRAVSHQHDPAQMIEVIEADNPPYHTLRPASAEDMVRKEQAEVWDGRTAPDQTGSYSLTHPGQVWFSSSRKVIYV